MLKLYSLTKSRGMLHVCALLLSDNAVPTHLILDQ